MVLSAMKIHDPGTGRNTRQLLVCGDFETGFGAMERVQSPIYINVRIATSEALLSALFRLACTFYINFRWAFRCFGQDRHFVGEDFRKSPSHSQLLLCAVFAVSDFANR